MDLLLNFPSDNGLPDLTFAGGDLSVGDGLLETLWLYLFTDRRAPEHIQIESEDRRGNWRDALSVRPLGSLLWTLKREKQTEETRLRAKQIVEEAVAWIPASDEPAVRDVTAVAVRVWYPRRGIMGIAITLTRSRGARSTFEFERGLEDGRARIIGTI